MKATPLTILPSFVESNGSHEAILILVLSQYVIRVAMKIRSTEAACQQENVILNIKTLCLNG
jgi:hypothetical protein